MTLKATAQALTRRIEAMTSLRQRLGVDEMDNLERARLAVELKALHLPADTIHYITDMKEINKHGKNEI